MLVACLASAERSHSQTAGEDSSAFACYEEDAVDVRRTVAGVEVVRKTSLANSQRVAPRIRRGLVEERKHLDFVSTAAGAVAGMHAHSVEAVTWMVSF